MSLTLFNNKRSNLPLIYRLYLCSYIFSKSKSCVLPLGAVGVLLGHSQPVSKSPQHHSATPQAPSDPKQTSATCSYNPANALTHRKMFIYNCAQCLKYACKHTHIIPHVHIKHIQRQACRNAHTEKDSQHTLLLKSVLVELVQFAPVETEQVDGLLDSLALQRSSTRHHLLPVSQNSIDGTSQLVNVPLYVLHVWKNTNM